VSQQKSGDGREDLLGLLTVEVGQHLFAYRCTGAGRYLRLNSEQGVSVVGAEQLIVCGQIGQHFFCVGAAVYSQQNFHKASPERDQQALNLASLSMQTLT